MTFENFIEKINQFDVLERLIYVVDEGVSDDNFKKITAEMIKQKTKNPCSVFYFSTKDKKRYSFLRNEVFALNGSTEILPYAGEKIELFLKNRANIIISFNSNEGSKRKSSEVEVIVPSRESFILTYE